MALHRSHDNIDLRGEAAWTNKNQKENECKCLWKRMKCSVQRCTMTLICQDIPHGTLCSTATAHSCRIRCRISVDLFRRDEWDTQNAANEFLLIIQYNAFFAAWQRRWTCFFFFFTPESSLLHLYGIAFYSRRQEKFEKRFSFFFHSVVRAFLGPLLLLLAATRFTTATNINLLDKFGLITEKSYAVVFIIAIVGVANPRDFIRNAKFIGLEHLPFSPFAAFRSASLRLPLPNVIARDDCVWHT